MSPRQSIKPWRLCVNAAIEHTVSARHDSARVAAMFGLPGTIHRTLYDNFRFEIAPGQIVAVVGPSGAGKSVLLRHAARCGGSAAVIELGLGELAASSRPAVELLRGGSLARRLELLSRCGLADAMALVTPARRLSGGQLYRLAMARAMHRARRRGGRVLIIADEFAANLDDVTARLLCRQVRKMVGIRKKANSQQAAATRGDATVDVALLLATPRMGLLEDLRPDVVIVKPLGERASIVTSPLSDTSEAATDDPRAWPIERGTIQDYHALSQFHYLAGPAAAHKRVYVIRAAANRYRLDALGGIAAVLVVSPPVMNVRGRNVATARRYCGRDRSAALRLLNREIECISRVIVHPSYRGCGLAVRLVRYALTHAEAPWMEALAAMGEVHPFFELAGMQAWRLWPDEHAMRLLSAAQSVGLAAGQVAAVDPVRQMLRKGGSKASFLQGEIERCARKLLDAKRRRRIAKCRKPGPGDMLTEVCRRATRQYVYYLGPTALDQG